MRTNNLLSARRADNLCQFHQCVKLKPRRHLSFLRPQFAIASSTSSASAATIRPTLADRLSKCCDLASIHKLLLEEATRVRAATTQPRGTRPFDAVAAFSNISERWRNSAQGPLDAALLADSLQAAYTLLDAHMTALQPRQVAAVIISMTGLRSASPEVLRRLADTLMRRPAAAGSYGSGTTPIGSAAAVPVTGGAGAPPLASSATAPHPSPPAENPPGGLLGASTDPGSQSGITAAMGMSRLTSAELAAVVASLASFNVRPGDAWLGACMSCLQPGLPYLSGPQLAQLLWALVQLGVRPTSPWLTLYEEALSSCLERRRDAGAARSGGGSGRGLRTRTRSRSQPQSQAMEQQPGPGGASVGGGGEVSASVGAENPVPASSTRTRSRTHSRTRADDELSCEDLVRVIRAAAEVAFQPGERCRGLLLAALQGQLEGMQPHQVSGLAWAMTRLGWRVDEHWRRTFLQVTSSCLPQLRAADLPPVLAFVASADLAPDRRWLRRCLESSLQHLPQVSPRDLPELLYDMAALDPDRTLFWQNNKYNDSGSDSAGGDREVAALAAGWMRRYLQLCVEKLPRFTASGVARMMVAVAQTGWRPDDRWLQASCAALASKSDVLAPSDVADAVTALATLRRQRLDAATTTTTTASSSSSGTAPPLAAASSAAPLAAARDSRSERFHRALLEALLSGCATKLPLLPDDQLVGLMAALAELDVRSDPVWLQPLMDKTLVRLQACAPPPLPPPRDDTVAAAAAPPGALTSSPPKPVVLPGPSAAPVGGAACSLTPRLLSDLVVAVAKLGVEPQRRWVAAFLGAAGRQMGSFDAAALSGMMWGLVVLDVRPPASWTVGLMELVRSRLAEQEGRDGGAGGGGGGGGGGGPEGRGAEDGELLAGAAAWAMHPLRAERAVEEMAGADAPVAAVAAAAAAGTAGATGSAAAAGAGMGPAAAVSGQSRVQLGGERVEPGRHSDAVEGQGQKAGGGGQGGAGSLEGPGRQASRTRLYGYLPRRYGNSSSSNRTPTVMPS